MARRDTLSLANTGQPYRESIILSGAKAVEITEAKEYTLEIGWKVGRVRLDNVTLAQVVEP